MLCFCIACHRPVYSMLPVFLDCQFLIATSVLSNVDVIKKNRRRQLFIVLCLSAMPFTMMLIQNKNLR